MHIVSLKQYKDALARLKSSPQVAVPFAAEDDCASTTKPMEVVWEGRVFDTSDHAQDQTRCGRVQENNDRA